MVYLLLQVDLAYSELFKGPLSYLAMEKDEDGKSLIKITADLNSLSYDFASVVPVLKP